MELNLEQAQTIRFAAFAGGLVFFLAMERIRPYRASSVSKTRRWFRNLALAGANNVVLALVVGGAVVALSLYVQEHRLGLLYAFSLPEWLRILATVVVLDLFLWAWHVANHLIPLLWRFHRVHHADMNMDVSTATRFHLGELAAAVPLKMGVIYALGAHPVGVLVFETAVLLTTQFHHSSLRVPAWFENLWWRLFVPPSMHRIHHSVVIRERDSNYGVILSVWDRVFGTMVRGVDQDRITIGLGAYRKHEKLGFAKLWVMPFTPPVR